MKTTQMMCLILACITDYAMTATSATETDGVNVNGIIKGSNISPAQQIHDAINKHLETSGLYLSPESVREYGKEWKTDPDATFQRLSTNALALATDASTNETASVELRKILEFLVSPLSRDLKHGKLQYQKAVLLVDTNCAMMGTNTNAIVGIANALALVNARKQETSRGELGAFNNDLYGMESHLFGMLQRRIRQYWNSDAEDARNIISQISEISGLREKHIQQLHMNVGLEPGGSESTRRVERIRRMQAQEAFNRLSSDERRDLLKYREAAGLNPDGSEKDKIKEASE